MTPGPAFASDLSDKTLDWSREPAAVTSHRASARPRLSGVRERRWGFRLRRQRRQGLRPTSGLPLRQRPLGSLVQPSPPAARPDRNRICGAVCQALTTLAHDWWTLPRRVTDCCSRLWRSGLPGAPVSVADAKANPTLGIAILVFAVLVRSASGLAAELFTMRGSMVIALVGLTVYHFGVRQVLRWWLPFRLRVLSIPLPELITQALALPLQFKASRMGAALLEMRGVPVR